MANLLGVVRSSTNFSKVITQHIRCSVILTHTIQQRSNLNFRLINHSKNFSNKKDDNDLTLSGRKNSEVSTTLRESVKETTKTASYFAVIVAGLGVTAVIFFAIFRELFSSKSPNNVYTKAAERCCDDDRVKNALGEPIKAYGEETRRGRRRHTSHIVYEKDGVQYIRMKFYLKGLRECATVHLEMKENESGDYAYRYLFVELDNYSRRVIVLEDNRKAQAPISSMSPEDLGGFTSPLIS